MDKPDDLAGGQGKALVERIVDPAVGLADHPHRRVARRLDRRQTAIARGPVNNQVLDIAPSLRRYAGDGEGNCGLRL